MSRHGCDIKLSTFVCARRERWNENPWFIEMVDKEFDVRDIVQVCQETVEQVLVISICRPMRVFATRLRSSTRE